MMLPLVNNVMSTAMKSSIFMDLNYRRSFDLRDSFRFLDSQSEILTAAVYHYHRAPFARFLFEPSIVTIHHDLMDPTYSFNNLVPLLKTAEHVVVLNHSSHQLLADSGVRNVTVIPHGFTPFSDLEKQTSEAIFARRKSVRLGILSKRYGNGVKGEDLLERFAAGLAGLDVHFVLVGSGRTKDVEPLRKLGFTVTCFESVRYSDLLNIQRSLDAQLILSRFEGGPASIAETLAAGIPVISRQVGMARDLIRHLENGILLGEDFENNLAWLVEFIKNDEFRGSLRRGAKNMSELITWHEVSQRYEVLYRNFLVE